MGRAEISPSIDHLQSTLPECGGVERSSGAYEGMLTSCPRCQASFGPLRPPRHPQAVLSVPASCPPESDLLRLRATLARLKASGWYHEGLKWRESNTLLASTAPGTFLVRDSSDRRFLFSLSVQTHKGPTSVRLHYLDGMFRLDADPSLVPAMPLFDCVVKLVEYYVGLTRDSKPLKSEGGREQVWVERTGRMYSDIHLSRPLYIRGTFPSLQHLSRLAVNKLDSVPTSSLPLTLRYYLQEYPYTH